MELQELYHLIDLQPEIVRSLAQISEQIDLRELESCLERLTDMSTAPRACRELKECLGEDEGSLKMLYCQLECARRVFDRYREKQISWEIYADTMKCFTRFIAECEKKNGRMFFDRGWWTYRQLSMDIFRIGALEYQFQSEEGENTVTIHIPSDADMSEEAVDRSLEQADAFFRTFYGGFSFDQYTCDSWLMAPALRPLLSEKSHILSFQKRFEILRQEKEGKEFIEWLFQVPADTDYEKLPINTGLQRKVRELLLEGGSIGTAYGVMRRPGQS